MSSALGLRSLVLLTIAPLVLVSAPWPAAAAAAGVLAVPADSSFDPRDNGDPVQVRTLSGRADVVSGGDALIEVVVPAGTDLDAVEVTVGDRDVSEAFVAAGPGLRGLVTGLPLGTSTITATLADDTGARLLVKNASQGGSVFSGPLIEPWTCRNGSAAPDCAQPPAVTYSYRSTDPARPGLQDYDPENPPDDVATTTTDEGNTVPFIVRQEEGYSLRDQYRIAALYDPAQGATPSPTAEAPGFADKLVLTHGASCDTAYESGTAPDVLFEDALSQGFAVASHALDNSGHNCNIVTQAESLIMVKEMVVERFGPLRYTIGSGCSGGSLVQQQIANAYPGVYQGITPQCSFTDAWSSSQQKNDYVLLQQYFNSSEAAQAGITAAQHPSIYGHPNEANVVSFVTVIPNNSDPSRDCPGVAPEDVYSESNQDGLRCSFQDYMRNIFGIDEATGKARRPVSNQGVQYGLSGLLASLGGPADPTRPPLTPEQFVALNAEVGSLDVDYERTQERSTADPLAQDRVYRSGAANTGAHMDEVAIIDLGGPEPGAFHDVYRKFSMRERLVREHGTADNQVFWQGQVPLLGDPSFVDDSITAMDDWLAAIEADRRDVPLPQKVIEAKDDADIGERCVATGGAAAPLEFCRAAVGATLFSSPRIEAGGGDQALVNGVGPAVVGFTDDRLDCQTIPLEQHVYAGRSFTEVFTPVQQATLKTTFPAGVCDYSKPGVGFQDATTWLTYQDAAGGVVVGGTPLGTAPTSTYFASAAGPAPVVPEAPLAVALPLAALVAFALHQRLRPRRAA